MCRCVIRHNDVAVPLTPVAGNAAEVATALAPEPLQQILALAAIGARVALAFVLVYNTAKSLSLSLLKQIHWLPVNYIIKFKNHLPTPPQLYVPITNLNPDKRAFSVAAPDIWNQLTTTLNYCQ